MLAVLFWTICFCLFLVAAGGYEWRTVAERGKGEAGARLRRWYFGGVERLWDRGVMRQRDLC